MATAPRTPPIAEPPIRLAVLASGGGSTLQNLIDRVTDGRLRTSIVQVIVSRSQAGAAERAERAGLPVEVVRRGNLHESAYERALFEPIRAAGADLVVLAGFLSLVPVPSDFEGRILNIHPALLPAFGGRGYYGDRVHEAAIETGVKLSGCTVHFVDEHYDHGPIVLQRAVPVLDDDGPATLGARVRAAERDALPEAIALYAEGRLKIEGRRVRILDPVRE